MSEVERSMKLKVSRDFEVAEMPKSVGGGYRIIYRSRALGGACIIAWEENPATEALAGPFVSAAEAEAALEKFVSEVNGRSRGRISRAAVDARQMLFDFCRNAA